MVLTLLASSRSLISVRSSFVKTKPTLPLMWGRSLSNHMINLSYTSRSSILPRLKSYGMSETMRPWLSWGCRQTGIAGITLILAGGTTIQHDTSCTVTNLLHKKNLTVQSSKESRRGPYTHFSSAGLFSR